MININGMILNIKESWYNKTKIQEDGVTHTIDINKQYPMYQVQIFKNYYDLNSREEVVKSLIADLSMVLEDLSKTQNRCGTRDTEDGKEV